jgi:hypothetical protein
MEGCAIMDKKEALRLARIKTVKEFGKDFVSQEAIDYYNAEAEKLMKKGKKKKED